MNFDLLKRLRRLELETAKNRGKMTAFTLEDGTQFLTSEDPVSYLIQNGPQTPRGKIVRYEHGEKDVDPITRSLYGYIDELIGGAAV